MNDDQITQITEADWDAARSILWVATTIDDETSIAEAFAKHRLTHSPASDVGDSDDRTGCPVIFCACYGCQGAPHCKLAADRKAALRSQPASGDAVRHLLQQAVKAATIHDANGEWDEVMPMEEWLEKSRAALATPTTLASADDGLELAAQYHDRQADIHAAFAKSAAVCRADQASRDAHIYRQNQHEADAMAIRNLKPKPEQEGR